MSVFRDLERDLVDEEIFYGVIDYQAREGLYRSDDDASSWEAMLAGGQSLGKCVDISVVPYWQGLMGDRSMLTRSALLLLTSILVIGSLLTGCTPRQGAATAGERDGDLSLGLWVSRTQVEGGEPIELRFTVKNIGEHPEVIRLEEKPVMDIRIRLGSGPTWKYLYWSDGRESTTEMRMLQLAP